MADRETIEAIDRLGNRIASLEAENRRLVEDYRTLLCAQPDDQYEALQEYLSSSVNGKRTIDAARAVLSPPDVDMEGT